MRADDIEEAGRVAQRQLDPIPLGFEPQPLSVEANVDVFGLENVADRGGNILVLAADQARAALDDGHFAAEAPIHLREFETDIAAADDDQMLRQEIDVHHGAVGEIGYGVDAGDIGDGRPAPGIDEDAISAERGVADDHGVRIGKAGMAAIDRATGHALQPGFDARAGFAADSVHAGLDQFHVDARLAGDGDAVFGGAEGKVRRIGAGDQGLGRDATGIDAGASERAALDDGHCLSGIGQPAGKRWAGLPGTDDDGVIMRHWSKSSAGPWR